MVLNNGEHLVSLGERYKFHRLMGYITKLKTSEFGKEVTRHMKWVSRDIGNHGDQKLRFIPRFLVYL